MKWIDVRDVGASASGKTRRFEVTTRAEPVTVLGRIQWYPAWRRYCFLPAFPTVLESDCLRDIATFLEATTLEHKAAMT